MGTAGEVFRIFLRLGLTSFGGPVAHLGYFRDAFVVRRNWFDDRAYADLVALCQFMPGPVSSQVGFAIGLSRAGYAGALAAWAGFTLPSALVMVLFAFGLQALGGGDGPGWLAGLKVVAVAVVAQAVWGMGRSLCPDRERATLAVAAAAIVLMFPNVFGQVGAIAFGAVVGLALLRTDDDAEPAVFPVPVGRPAGIAALVLFFALLIGLPFAAGRVDSMALAYVDSFYRSGALVFGGGHVILPLLQAEVVNPGWVGADAFVAGYGAAQAIPGPLFTFAAYLGTVMTAPPNGIVGALICVGAIFLPSVFLVVGLLPFWAQVRRLKRARAALMGVNAAVVGLLLAALYDPVFTRGVQSGEDLALALAALLLLMFWKLPPWLVVMLTALGGAGLMALRTL